MAEITTGGEDPAQDGAPLGGVHGQPPYGGPAYGAGVGATPGPYEPTAPVPVDAQARGRVDRGSLAKGAGLLAAGLLVGALTVTALQSGGSASAAATPAAATAQAPAPTQGGTGQGSTGQGSTGQGSTGQSPALGGQLPGGTFGGGMFGGGQAGETRVLGTISGVTGSSVTVTSTDGSTATYAVDSSTEIARDGQQVSVSDLQTGDRVLVHVLSGGVAERILVGTPLGAGAAPQGTQPQTPTVPGTET